MVEPKVRTGLQVFHDYKNKIFEALVEGDTPLVRAIANSSEEFMDTPVENPAELLHTQIFPFKWAGMDILEKKQAYITMTFGVDRLDGGYFNSVFFTIYVIVHKDIMRIFHEDSYKIRTDFIAEEIEGLFHKSSDFGLGKLELFDTGEIFVSKEFPGTYLSFRTVDQSRQK